MYVGPFSILYTIIMALFGPYKALYYIITLYYPVFLMHDKECERKERDKYQCMQCLFDLTSNRTHTHQLIHKRV